jgi:hypothetical protein
VDSTSSDKENTRSAGVKSKTAGSSDSSSSDSSESRPYILKRSSSLSDSRVNQPDKPPFSESLISVAEIPNVDSIETHRSTAPALHSSSLPEVKLAHNMMIFIFTFIPSYSAKTVSLTGTFDDWSKSVEMIKTEDSWKGQILLNPRMTYEYKFVVDGIWLIDTSRCQKIDQVGNINNYLDIDSNEGMYISSTNSSRTNCDRYSIA